MPVLPNVPKGFITNLTGSVPDFVGPRQFVFLLCWVAVFTLGLLFFDSTFFGGEISKTSYSALDSAEINSLAVSALRPSARRMYGFQTKGLENNKTYAGYLGLFQIVSGDYYSFSNKDSRLLLEKISLAAKESFPSEYKDTDFIIPCLDNGCQLLEPEPVIAEIIETVKKTEVTAEAAKTLAVNSLLSIKYYENAKQENLFDIYNPIFNQLVGVYNFSNKDPKVGDSLKKFQLLISQKFPEKYAEYEAIKYYEFQN